MMKLTSFICLLLVAVLPSLPKAKADARFIENTCRQTPNYKLCVSTLKSNPRSFSADVTGLALIIVDAVKAKATRAMGNINKFKRTMPRLRTPLAQCSQSYFYILSAGIPEAKEALTKGDPKFAEDGMVNSALESQSCENNLKPYGSPLTSLNVAVHDLSIVARAIIRMLL